MDLLCLTWALSLLTPAWVCLPLTQHRHDWGHRGTLLGCSFIHSASVVSFKSQGQVYTHSSFGEIGLRGAAIKFLGI